VMRSCRNRELDTWSEDEQILRGEVAFVLLLRVRGLEGVSYLGEARQMF
jgi:hypothetical protein